jgi:site-specific DNA-methyltransferase (adenine-specific)
VLFGQYAKTPASSVRAGSDATANMLPPEKMNTLYYGDNLAILRECIPDKSVDLVYLDPPFQSGRDYNVLFEERDGTQAAAQVQAFEDTWDWDVHAAAAFDHTVASGGSVADALLAFRQLLRATPMLAYLAMMAPRLVELRRVLRPTGSLFLHCDPTASHYLKLLLDAVFGPQRFVNEIIWQRSLPHGNVSRKFGASHDVILFYRVSDAASWNGSFVPHRAEYLEQFYRFYDTDGRRYRLISCINPNPDRPNLTYAWRGITKVWKFTKERMAEMDRAGLLVYSKNGVPQYKGYLDSMKGTPTQDIWADIPPLMGSARERLGYPTQKPVTLLKRIIEASTQEGAVVLDPFCGCGTTIEAAQQLNREWIGIDITHLAVGLIKRRLSDAFGLNASTDYRVVGEPTDHAGAAQLALDDRHQFEHWALGLVGARASAHGKGADRGIDGVLLFQEGGTGSEHKRVLISVKSGKVSSAQVRDLRGTVERERASIGVLITLLEPTKDMKAEAAAAGFYESPWGRHPHIQILTIQTLLDGQRINMPPIRPGGTTFKQAPRAPSEGGLTLALPGFESPAERGPTRARRTGKPGKTARYTQEES